MSCSGVSYGPIDSIRASIYSRAHAYTYHFRTIIQAYAVYGCAHTNTRSPIDEVWISLFGYFMFILFNGWRMERILCHHIVLLKTEYNIHSYRHRIVSTNESWMVLFLPRLPVDEAQIAIIFIFISFRFASWYEILFTLYAELNAFYIKTFALVTVSIIALCFQLLFRFYLVLLMRWFAPEWDV